METGRFDAARARRSLEESLERLGLDRVQVLHLHDPEHARDLAEVTGTGGAIEELFRMKEEGLAQAVGLAMGRIDVMAPILRDRPFDVLLSHNRHTLLNRSAGAMFDEAQARGIAILNAAPYASGVLAKGSAVMPRIACQDAGAEELEPVRRIEAACARHGVAVGAAALQFSLRDPRVASTVVGVSKPERVTETLGWAAADIPEGLWRELDGLAFSTEDPRPAGTTSQARNPGRQRPDHAWRGAPWLSAWPSILQTIAAPPVWDTTRHAHAERCNVRVRRYGRRNVPYGAPALPAQEAAE